MSRRHRAQVRQVIPDAKYGNTVIAKFVNCIMYRGQKSTAEKIVYDALDNINKKTGNDPVQVFMDAIDAVKPAVEVRSRRVGGATYQVPMEIREVRRLSLAIKWLITYSRKRSEKTVSERVAGEILDAINNRGGAVKKREDTHKMADANKAFAHYRW